jgi:MurNAc alpha-1-phosphate uridylyltransferase
MSEAPATAVILAGGLGTRLLPLTQTVPKALVDVNGEPFIAHQLRLLAENGVRHGMVCAGHLGEMIVEEIGDGGPFGVGVEYSFDGPRLLGTAGAIRRVLNRISDPFFVLYGDSYLNCDYQGILAQFHRSGCPALMTVFRNAGKWETSNVEYAGGRILEYDKRNPTPRMEHVDYGLGVFRKAAFADVPAEEFADLADLYQRLVRRGQVAAAEVTTRFYEIGSPTGLEETRQYLAQRRGAERATV